MKKILYTGYYAKHGRDPLAVAISAKAPSYFIGRWYLALAPSWDIINGIKYGNLDERGYTKAYLNLIINERKLDPYKIVDDLPDGSILLCYEKNDGSFCHRHIVAEWLERTTGVTVIEKPDPVLISPVDDLLIF